MNSAAPTECVSISDSISSPPQDLGQPKIVCVESDVDSVGSDNNSVRSSSVPDEITIGTAEKNYIIDEENKYDKWLSTVVSTVGRNCISRDTGHGNKGTILRKCSTGKNLRSPVVLSTPDKVDTEQIFPAQFDESLKVSYSLVKRQETKSHRKEAEEHFQKCLSHKEHRNSFSIFCVDECGLQTSIKPQHNFDADCGNFRTSLSSENVFDYNQALTKLQGRSADVATLPCLETGNRAFVEETRLDSGKLSSGNHVNILSSPSASVSSERSGKLWKLKKELSGRHVDIISSPSGSLNSKSDHNLWKTKEELTTYKTDGPHSACIGSDSSDDSLHKLDWEDNLKLLIRDIKTTDCDNSQTDQCQVSSNAIHHDDRGCYKGFSRKRDFFKPDVMSDKIKSSDDNATVIHKRPKKNAGQQWRKTVNAGFDDDGDTEFDLEAETQRKAEERLKTEQEKQNRKNRLHEERENIRREKEEEKKRLQEARRKRKQEDKQRKEELRAEAVEHRKLEREKEKWGRGKFALKSITAFVDTEILEGGLIGGHLLTRFAEKGFKFHLVRNPLRKTVIWKMHGPSKEGDSKVDDFVLKGVDYTKSSQGGQDQDLLKSRSELQFSLKSTDVSYVLVVLEAEEFLEMIVQDVLDSHIKGTQKRYPGFTVCYLINKLMRYLHKREQQQYRSPQDKWVRPPVEQILARFVTSYDGVHSRLCLDEAEVAEHIVGLTRSLAECPFRRKLTAFSLSANGDHVVKNDPNSETIKKSVWLKALVAIPKVSASCAIAVAKKYPSMRSLYNDYMDPSKTIYEKEHLLENLVKEGILGGERNRCVGAACSQRIYRILMAQQGALFTVDVEEGADNFKS